MLRTRPAAASDVEFLWSMLFYAAHADKQPEATTKSIRADPELNRYVRDWGRVGDRGIIALKTGTPVAAAWLRLFTADEEHLATFVAPDVQELVIAVEPSEVGQGVGSFLLDELLAEADRAGVDPIVLSARADNPAIRLYRRSGFRQTGQITNRVGTASITMERSRRVR